MIKEDCLVVVSDVVKEIDELFLTGRCPLSKTTCCADCPADEDPEDVTACYVYMLKHFKNKLNSLL